MEYKGFFKCVNEEPKGEYVQLFVSDWNKDHWAFYAYIEQDNWEEDIQAINDLITKLNYRDGDWYIELVNHSDGLKGFYHFMYDSSSLTHSIALEDRAWELLDEFDDNHFGVFNAVCGGNNLDELESFEYSSFEDYDEMLEIFHPDLYKSIDEANAWGAFDSERMFYGEAITEHEGRLIVAG